MPPIAADELELGGDGDENGANCAKKSGTIGG